MIDAGLSGGKNYVASSSAVGSLRLVSDLSTSSWARSVNFLCQAVISMREAYT